MDFGLALRRLQEGKKLQRAEWHDRGMWVIYVPGTSDIKPVPGTPYSNAGLGKGVCINPHLDLYTARGNMQPGWTPTQEDMFAEDWQEVQ